ncbi:hypothetical protein [Sphaerisporangium sp. NPDC051011]|uniref:hypothetical protein n=1 Tax=Sphaerisporangium sp. NPDC051011 TaxID=3155792 RepID=UPI0033DF5727
MHDSEKPTDTAQRDGWLDELRPELVRAAVDLGMDERTVGEQLDDLNAHGAESPHTEMFLRLAASLPALSPALQPALDRLDDVPHSDARRIAIAQIFHTTAPAVAQLVRAGRQT